MRAIRYPSTALGSGSGGSGGAVTTGPFNLADLRVCGNGAQGVSVVVNGSQTDPGSGANYLINQFAAPGGAWDWVSSPTFNLTAANIGNVVSLDFNGSIAFDDLRLYSSDGLHDVTFDFESLAPLISSTAGVALTNQVPGLSFSGIVYAFKTAMSPGNAWNQGTVRNGTVVYVAGLNYHVDITA